MRKARNENVATAYARYQVYALLATVFRAEPDAVLIREIRSSRFLDAFDDLELNLGEDFGTLPESELEERLGIEFTRLFFGPGSHISAHESVFSEMDGDTGGLWGKKTVQVKKFIESTGLSYDDCFSGLPDHVSAELEFMSKLTDWEASMRGAGDETGTKYCLKIQNRFLKEHLGRWAPALCKCIIERADLAFYREMASVFREFLEFDCMLVKEQLFEVEGEGVPIAAGS